MPSASTTRPATGAGAGAHARAPSSSSSSSLSAAGGTGLMPFISGAGAASSPLLLSRLGTGMGSRATTPAMAATASASASTSTGAAAAAAAATAAALPDPAKGLALLTHETLPVLEQAGMAYFDAVEAKDASQAMLQGELQDTCCMGGNAQGAFDAALAATLHTLSEYGLARMPLQPTAPPESPAALVEDVQVEYERRERVREGASLVQSVLRQNT
ncbi:hypothetical protein OC842_006349 [Tilletia horrida]|uniref:Uncharacterized protein n=1 Tax=Tilletia horrida TaxID=155126 RepID=A0AAN6G650_9BASI|nr:hypothetical protein OC842_006349 [Tilletia horrida]